MDHGNYSIIQLDHFISTIFHTLVLAYEFHLHGELNEQQRFNKFSIDHQLFHLNNLLSLFNYTNGIHPNTFQQSHKPRETIHYGRLNPKKTFTSTHIFVMAQQCNPLGT